LRHHAHPAQVPLAASACAAWVGALSGPALYQRPVLLVLLAFVTAALVHRREPAATGNRVIGPRDDALV
jgi:hypothetical protein